MTRQDREVSYPALERDAHTLLARCHTGVLSTLDPRDGTPYASLVEITSNAQGVWMFLSTLAAHSTNLLKDERASILVREPTRPRDGGSALGLARLTLMGKVERMPRDEQVVQMWLERHPEAEGYVHFSDFHFHLLRVERARYVAGFGRMGWLDESTWSESVPLDWAASIDDIVAHMNEDHGQNLIDYVHALKGKAPEHVSMIGVDELGCDVMATWSDDGRERIRLMFASPATRVELVRKELVRMAHEARAQIAS